MHFQSIFGYIKKQSGKNKKQRVTHTVWKTESLWKCPLSVHLWHNRSDRTYVKSTFIEVLHYSINNKITSQNIKLLEKLFVKIKWYSCAFWQRSLSQERCEVTKHIAKFLLVNEELNWIHDSARLLDYTILWEYYI